MHRLRLELSALLALAACLAVPHLVFGQAAAAPAAASAAPPVMEAKIASKFNTKNGRVGDVINAKTERAYKLPDGTAIPKGSLMTGKVSAVQSKKAGNGNSMLTFRFDQIVPKGGAPLPIKGMVVAIGPSLAPKVGLGGNSVLSRNVNSQSGTGVTSGSQGTGSSSGMDPSLGLGSSGAKDEDDIQLGSTMEAVALGHHLDEDWSTALQGIKTDIDLDSEIVIKVQLK